MPKAFPSCALDVFFSAGSWVLRSRSDECTDHLHCKCPSSTSHCRICPTTRWPFQDSTMFPMRPERVCLTYGRNSKLWHFLICTAICTRQIDSVQIPKCFTCASVQRASLLRARSYERGSWPYYERSDRTLRNGAPGLATSPEYSD